MPAEAEDTYVAGLAQEIAAELAPKLAALMDTRPLLNKREAAARLGISPRLLEYHVSEGRIGVVDVGQGNERRVQRFEQAELDRFLASRRSGSSG